MSELPSEINTPRLLLRRWRVDDAPVLAAAIEASLEHLRPWMSWVALEPLTVEERIALIASWDDDWSAGGDAVYGVFVDEVVAGGCGLHRRAGPDALEIGYWIHIDHVRRGYATELVRGLTDAAFTVEGIERVEIHHDKANRLSGAVARSAGFGPGPERPDQMQAPGELGIDCSWSVTRTGWTSSLGNGDSGTGR